MTRRSLATALCAFTLVSGAGVVHVRVATQAATATRTSILEGAANFRDIGGYATVNGKHVRKGLVYRSNQLSDLTAGDYEKLNALGIKLVCDFRTNGERERQPTMWQGPAPEMMRAQIMKDQDVNMSQERIRELTSRNSASALGSAYEGMVAAEPATEFGKLYKQIAAGKFPVIAHCTAGKDRTGVFSAVLLTMLEVPRSSVIDDYMLTGEYMLTPKGMAQARKDMQRYFGSEVSDDTARTIYAMHADVLTSTFATIDRQWGSFDGFVWNGLKLMPEEVAALKHQLLE